MSRRGTRLTRRIILLALVAATGAVEVACNPSPCGDDPLGCGSGEEFVPAEDCELTGPLEVALGTGVDEFIPLAEGEEPTVHEGAQGGHHLCLGLRVEQPSLDYPQLSVVMDAELVDPERCSPDDPSCDPWIGSAHRELVLGPDLPLDGQDNVEETGLILILSIWPPDLDRRVQVRVTDPCGREGFIDHRIPPST